MKTYTPKKDQLQHKWYLVDAKGKTLGRLATRIATILQGKHKATYAPHMVTGDYVIVINSKDIVVTGNKVEQKLYHTHSGFLGGIKQATLKEKLEKDPDFVITHAVSGMLPNNKLKKIILKNLKIYSGAEHQHEAQKPEKLEIS